MRGLVFGPVIDDQPGITVYRPCTAQLLAMKLSAWRDDTDITDARILLEAMVADATQESAWKQVAPFVVYGRKLKAQYAFLDLWESCYGSSA